MPSIAQRWTRGAGLALAAMLVLTAIPLLAQTAPAPKTEQAPLRGNSFRPAKLPATDERIASLKLPPGFKLEVAARDLGDARILLLLPDGSLAVSLPRKRTVLRLIDADKDGKYEQQQPMAEGIDLAHGLALHRSKVYLAGVTQVLSAGIGQDGRIDEWRQIAALPDGGQHGKRTLLVGPDDMLYVSVGSTCNDCTEPNPEHATMLRMRPGDGGAREVFARGLRNTIGFAFHPKTRELWGMDHGSDWRGDDDPPEELNRIQQGKDYGWPWCVRDRQPDIHSNPPKDKTREQHCAQSDPPVLGYQAHSAPIGMIFYDGDRFPEEFRGDAFVAMQGSWNRKPAVGYKVVRIRFADGQPKGFEDFITGFLTADGQSQFGTPAGLVVDRDGSLLISDDTNGMLYRVRWTGK